MAEIRKEMPEEMKNEVVDGKKRVLTEKIPEKILKKLQESTEKKNKALQEILNASVAEMEAHTMKEQAYEKLKNAKKSMQNYLNTGAKKLKLNKKKDYYWRFDRKDSFVGVYNPPKPKKEEK